MRTYLHHHRGRRIPFGLVAIMLTAGCTEAGTGPDDNDGGGSPLQTMTVTLKSIDALEPCEEAFTDFDGGEFGWRIAVLWPDGSQNVLGSTSAFPGAGGYRQIKKNASMATSVSASKQLRGAAGMMVTVEARASEFDFDLFGNNPFADNRMNDVRVNVNHTYGATGWSTGDRALDVHPVSACHLRVRYSVAVS